MPTRSSYFSEIVLTPLFVLLMCATVKESSQFLSKPSPDECLRKCDLAREESFITKVTRFFSCYHICLNRNKEDRPALSEIISRLRTRKALPPTNHCPDSSKNQSVKWKPSKVNVSFGQYENTSSWYVNVSWTPINETAHENCTDILVRLVVPAEDSFVSSVHCSLHPRNQTFLRRNISQYNYHYPNPIFVNILALPYPADFSGEQHPFVPKIPTSPSLTTTTATSPSPSASKCFNEYGDLVWYPSEVNADFLQGSEKDWYANISWTPLTDPTVTWTGYLITVFVGDISGSGFSTALQCFKLPKNQTYVIVDSSEGWEYPNSISVNVTAYPRPRLEMADLKYFSPVKYTVKNTVKHTVKIPDSPEPVSASPNTKTGKLNVVKTVFGSVGGFAAVVVLLIAVWFIRRRTCGTKPTVVATESRKSFKHHAFIIYNTVDSEWVDNTLIPTLESYGFNCCVHWKDFLPGKAYTENIVESVYNSFKIIAVVSSHFMDSKPCEFELQHAMTRQMNNGDDCLIVIKLDDAGVKRLPMSILNNSYIDFTQATDRSTWDYKLAVVLNEAVVEDDSSRTSTTSTKDNNNRLSEGSSTASESRDLICSCQSV